MNVIEFSCPQCGKPIELSETDAGSTRPCPLCEEWVRIPSADEAARDGLAAASRAAVAPTDASTRPSPPTRISAPDKDPPTPGRASALGGGWSCLITGLLAMYALPEARLMYVPLLGVAFILGIVALAQGKAIGGQLVLMLSLLAPAILGVHFLGMEVPEWARIPVLTDPAENTETRKRDPATPDMPPPTTEPSPSARRPPSQDPIPDDSGWFALEGEPEALPPATDWGSPTSDAGTDWQERYDYWVAQYSVRFKPPVVGTFVSLEQRSGIAASGTLLSVGPDRVVLQNPYGSTSYEQERLAEPTRRKFFRKDFARFYAQRRIQDERGSPDHTPLHSTRPDIAGPDFDDLL